MFKYRIICFSALSLAFVYAMHAYHINPIISRSHLAGKLRASSTSDSIRTPSVAANSEVEDGAESQPLNVTLKPEDQVNTQTVPSNWLSAFQQTQLDPSICDRSWKNFDSCMTAVSWSNASTLVLDDCPLLFLDVGSNIGMHTRFLYEPALYGDDHPYAKVFDDHFGRARDGSRSCSLGFEPNPQHRPRHQALALAYARRGWRYKCFFAAVSGQRSAPLTFYDHDKGKHQGWSFSIKKPELDGPLQYFLKYFEMLVGSKKLRGESARKFVVPSLNLAKFVLDFVSPKHERVLMKLDVEGSEYSVVPDMLKSRAFKHFTLVTAEFHPHYCPMEAGGTMWSADRCRAFEVRAVQEIATQSRATMVFIDDESFLHDGKPLPERYASQTHALREY